MKNEWQNFFFVATADVDDDNNDEDDDDDDNSNDELFPLNLFSAIFLSIFYLNQLNYLNFRK